MMKKLTLARMSMIAAAALVLIAAGGGLKFSLAQTPPAITPIAADVEAQPLSTTQPSTNASPIEAAWADLAGEEPLASTALLRMASLPDETTALLARELPPVQLSAEQLDPLLSAIGSEDDKIWQPACEQLKYFDPRLAVGLEDLMERVQDSPARNRLVAVLANCPYEFLKDKFVDLRAMNHADVEEGFNFVIYDSEADLAKKRGGSSIWAEHRVSRLGQFGDGGKPRWTRAVRGIVLLEHIGTPAARAIVDRLATGNPDAQPTRLAKEAIAARAKK